MEPDQSIYPGHWHSKEKYFGLHYDLHAGKDDTELGLRATPEELIPLLKLAAPDFVQTDCKGHPGYTSWYSQTPGASIPPALKADALAGWREATRQLGVPLHCHYSGIWDMAAGEKHPDWTQRDIKGNFTGAPGFLKKETNSPERMCPRSDYLTQLMIPQLLELIDRYGVDGFWIDGDLWASEPCYCERCRAEFTRRSGIGEPPEEPGDPNWPAWIRFFLDSFNEYVTTYCDAIHKHRPGVLICSNWLQTFRNPGAPVAPTDWISGDNTWVWGLDGSRCEARFISTRGKPWDIMLWGFYSSHGMGEKTSPWTFKPVQMLQQEAAVTLALGGSLQVYESPGVRTGQLVPWRMKRLGEVGEFVKARRSLCQDTLSIGQVAVLHSEAHVRQHMGLNLMWGVDPSPVQGAVFSLLENHYNVDILDEWALLQRIEEFPVVVVPEQNDLSPEMADRLQDYVKEGGKLLVSGSRALDRFSKEFLGVQSAQPMEKGVYFIPAGECSAPVYSENWAEAIPSTARVMGHLGQTSVLDDRLLPAPAWTLNTVGKGAVAWIPYDIFRSFDRNRYPDVRLFIGEVAEELIGDLSVRVTAPTCVDVILRKKDERNLVHLVNRCSGLPNVPSSGAVDEIPPVGPVTVEMDLPRRPSRVWLAFEDAHLSWDYLPVSGGGMVKIELALVHIHCAIVVEMD
jgi:hypothetical protein